MGLPENIDALLVKFDIKQDTLARIAGVSPSSVTRWRNGAQMRKDSIKKISEYFGITEDDLLSSDFGLAAKEHSKFKRTYPLPPNARHMVASAKATLPYRGRIHAGEPIEADGIEEITEVPEQVANSHPQGFVLDVVGDCMDNIYPEGCHVVVDPNLEPQTGQVGAFAVDGEMVMRRVLRGANTLILSPDSHNPAHKDMVISGEHEVITYGRIVWFQAAEEM